MNRYTAKNPNALALGVCQILHEMRQVVANKATNGEREITDKERDMEEFCKGMIEDFANCIERQKNRIEEAVLNFCNAFTLVYPPDDKDCPALLAGAFEVFKDEMGIDTLNAKAVSGVE